MFEDDLTVAYDWSKKEGVDDVYNFNVTVAAKPECSGRTHAAIYFIALGKNARFPSRLSQSLTDRSRQQQGSWWDGHGRLSKLQGCHLVLVFTSETKPSTKRPCCVVTGRIKLQSLSGDGSLTCQRNGSV